MMAVFSYRTPAEVKLIWAFAMWGAPSRWWALLRCGQGSVWKAATSKADPRQQQIGSRWRADSPTGLKSGSQRVWVWSSVCGCGAACVGVEQGQRPDEEARVV